MQNHTSKYILFLFNPFIALFSVLKDFREKNISYFFPVFLAFIGASLYPYGDAERYRDKFYEIHDNGISFQTFQKTLLDGETSFDVAVPLISYTIASFTRNEKLLFATFGLILGFFYGRNVQYILDKIDKQKATKFIVLLIVIFGFIVAPWDGIRGVRMWTAAHIYFYGVSRIIESKNLKYSSFLALAFTYHFSFLLPVLAFLGYYFLPKKQFLPIAFIFFVVSVLIADSNIQVIKSFVVNNTPELFQTKAEVYTGDEYIENIANRSNEYSFHYAISGSLLKFSFIYLLVLAYLGNLKRLTINNAYNRYFLFVFLLFGVANLISVLPSGGRFVKVALFFAILPIYYGYQQSIKKYLYHITIIPLLFWLVVSIREGFYSLSIGSVIGNPFFIFFDFATEQNLDSLIK